MTAALRPLESSTQVSWRQYCDTCQSLSTTRCCCPVSLVATRYALNVDGEDLRRARAELGITRDQLVAYSGVSRETLRKIEEKGYIPKAKTVVAIERGLTQAAEEVNVLQRLKALEQQFQTLESLVRLLLEARPGPQSGPQGE